MLFRFRPLPLLLVIALVAALPANAAQETQLRAVRGTVGYQLAPNAPFSRVVGSLLLTEDRIAITRAASNALLILTDSSEVALGENTSVVAGAVTQAALAAPNAISLTLGTIRFDVRHPKGGVSNYNFKTPTSQIAVRGTIGIVATGPNGDTITCLDCEPGDVTVTPNKRKAFALLTGQTATVSLTGEVAISATTASVTSTFAAVGLNSIARATTPFIPGIDRASETLGSTTPLVVGGAIAATVIGIEAASGSSTSGRAAGTPAPIVMPTLPATPTPAPTHTPTPSPVPSPTGALTINARARATLTPAPAAPASAVLPATGPGGRPGLPAAVRDQLRSTRRSGDRRRNGPRGVRRRRSAE